MSGKNLMLAGAALSVASVFLNKQFGSWGEGPNTLTYVAAGVTGFGLFLTVRGK